MNSTAATSRANSRLLVAPLARLFSSAIVLPRVF
jgi:hypothetical protein